MTKQEGQRRHKLSRGGVNERDATGSRQSAVFANPLDQGVLAKSARKPKAIGFGGDSKVLNKISSYDLPAILSLSCIFLLAAMIISSLRFCNRRCLSLRFCDHALSWCKIVLVLVSVLTSLFVIPESIWEARLYRDMRSWACGLGFIRDDELAVIAGVDGVGICGW